MPLSSPFAYIITYDLKQPPDKYLPLFDELRSSYKWWHFMAGTWLVLRNDALVELGP